MDDSFDIFIAPQAQTLDRFKHIGWQPMSLQSLIKFTNS